MNLDLIASIALVLAAIPCGLFLLNLLVYRRLPRTSRPQTTGNNESLSVLIPARNEEHNIRTTLEAVLTNRGCEFEVIVLDDHSTDRTAALVNECAARDSRVRLESAPPLPAGWCGKQHACHVLAGLALNPLLVFIDADVRLDPDALARMRDFMGREHVSDHVKRPALASGVPRQELGTFSERVLIPLIHFILMGFLPMHAMRRTRWPSMSAGCGQLFIIRRNDYEQCGGHAKLRDSLHDGIKLPRIFRKAGLATDLFDATDLATCRMYRTNADTWHGLGKNATEGLAAPGAILPMTALLLGGQVLPLVLLALTPMLSTTALTLSIIATGCAFVPRLVGVQRFRQPWTSALLHPFGVLALLAIQWLALVKKLAGRPMEWKGRAYAPVPVQERSAAARGALLGFCLFTLASSVDAATTPKRAGTNLVCASFQLHDQFEAVHTFSFPRTNLLLLTIADKQGNVQVDGWVQPLKTQFTNQLSIAGIADVRGIPGLWHRFIRGKFRKLRTHPVMLDWDGEVVEQFPVEQHRANVYLLNRDGVVLLRASGEANPAAQNTLLTTIERAFAKSN